MKQTEKSLIKIGGDNMNTAFNIFFALMFLVGVVTTLSLITIGLVYIGG